MLIFLLDFILGVLANLMAHGLIIFFG